MQDSLGSFRLPIEDPDIVASEWAFTIKEVNRLRVIRDILDRQLATHLAAGCLDIFDRLKKSRNINLTE